ncbi:hypothetical protein [Clavibacter michiganensis]|uniref:hypothetical protein n=1 Tax=Clavibacter michiganensis TaxID=28447 RepID=UPI0009A8EEEA|nr:hypothetical protein [Clavibacter michiganensis]MBF4638612.1 hypothetical protein [Clavibacter michiganensis subsp. michiganensis]MDO4124726.1 hypothetical protein [Clavibacter michiganensis]MDO4139494.1 hypothetical protein [Clavibacter michiganensis]MWJ07598.1 hypothetical protein [Clavibacter michiganensis subsp. michiganensis]MWJ88694.1 hypothetical protein [Clavibacter michiganensis subsp. michiganensis]
MTDAPASPRAFRRAFTAVILVLVLACGGLLAVAGSQGPRLVRTDVDPLAVVQQSRQRLVLAANRPIQPVDVSRIRMEPGADFTVDTQADRIIIDFTRPLAYDAAYTVSIDGVQGVGGGPTSDLATSFHTGDPGMYVLVRGGEQQADRILRQSVAGGGQGASDEVFEATKIQEYAVVGQSLVVATLQDDGTNGLVIAGLDGSGQVDLPLPGRGTLQDLHAEETGTTIGFRFTSTDGGAYDDTLMVDDVGAGATPAPVLGLDGQAISAQAWGFVLGRPQLVAHGQDGDLYLVTVDGSSPIVPLGRHGTLGPFSADGTRLAVTDPGSTTEIDLRTAQQTTLPTETGGADLQYDGAISFVPGDDGAVLRVRTALDPATGTATQRLVVVRDGTASDVYVPADPATRITGLSVTPNGRFALLETVPDPARGASDDYPRAPRDTSVTTLLVELATGTVTRSVAGFEVTIG